MTDVTATKRKLYVPAPKHHPLELSVNVICNECGCIVSAQWALPDADPKQLILCVDKCKCDSPLLKG